MARFDRYFLMTLADVAGYAHARLTLFAPDAQLQSAEIGDGNISFIFRV